MNLAKAAINQFCWAKKEDGGICGAVATVTDPKTGRKVCEAHGPKS